MQDYDVNIKLIDENLEKLQTIKDKLDGYD